MKKIKKLFESFFRPMKPVQRLSFIIVCCIGFIILSHYSNIISVVIRIVLVLILIYFLVVGNNGDG
jgi:4-hydroxybenzoate polyprenyltransferase